MIAPALVNRWFLLAPLGIMMSELLSQPLRQLPGES
jgi:hypothetical protein